MRRKILLVDDDREILDVLKEWLLQHDFEVLLAENGKEFRETAFSEKPDLIILDIMLGAENGVEVYNTLVDEGFDRNIPVIFLTGLADAESESRAAPGRVFALHTKPFNPEKLVEDIHCFFNA